MNPHDALTEIATLLERERSSRYKSKAFRAAADAIEGLTRRAAAGCRVPAPPQGHRRLDLRRHPGGARGRACPATSPICASGRACSRRRELRGLLRGDLHSHSDWSDGLTSIDLMVDAARALGHEYLALTDHSPRLRVANGLSPERLREQLERRRGDERRRASPCSRASRSTSSTTARSIRSPSCSTSSTSSSRRRTRSCGWSAGR